MEDCKKCDFYIEPYGCIAKHTDMFKCENQEWYMECVNYFD